MIKKTITYTDFDGVVQTEDLYFNMTKTDLVKFSFNLPDAMTETVTDPNKVDMEAMAEKLLEKMGKSGIFNFVLDLIYKAYGIKSEDGKRFIKNDEISTEFTQTAAYDEFVMDLFSDEKKASEFIDALMPADMVKQIGPNALKPVK